MLTRNTKRIETHECIFETHWFPFETVSCKLVLYGVDIPYLIKHSVFVSLNQYVLYTIVIRGNKDVWYWTVGTFQAIEITKDIYVLWIAFIAYSSEYLFDWGTIEDEL